MTTRQTKTTRAVTKKTTRRKPAPQQKLPELPELDSPPKKTGAPKGNQFWKARSSHGRKPKFQTPAILGSACEEYFEWVEQNPLWERKAFAYQGSVTYADLPKMRAMTIGGLCNFLDIDVSTWADYRQRRGFLPVITRIEERIRQQKFEGAAAEFLNPNIIARDLGLAEKREHSGQGGNPMVAVIAPTLSSEEATKQYHELIRGGKKR